MVRKNLIDFAEKRKTIAPERRTRDDLADIRDVRNVIIREMPRLYHRDKNSLISYEILCKELEGIPGNRLIRFDEKTQMSGSLTAYY